MTDERASELASWYSLPDSEKKKTGLPDERAVAEFLGVSTAFVRRAKEDKRVTARVREKLDIALLYDIVESRPLLAQVAKDPGHKEFVKAARTLEELAGNLTRRMGAPAPVNVNVLNNMDFGDMDDEEIILRARQILGQTPVEGMGPNPESD